MKTVRRDKLKRLAAAGRLVMVESYHFDDMTGESRGNKELPVRVMSGHGDWKEGWCNVWEIDFTTKSGSAWENPNGTITLYIHSNSNLDFRVLPADSVKIEPAAANT